MYIRKDVTTKEVLNMLYNDSALTMEGLKIDSVPEFIQWVRQYTQFKTTDIVYYVIKGSVMNRYYYLTGNNRYPDDLTIVSLRLSDMIEPLKLAVPRFQIGGRWFDDIVDNNARRQSGN